MRYIIGADEVGRGCLAGPLCVGAVLVPEDLTPVPGVRDSKKLTAAQREEVFRRLGRSPDVFFALEYVSAREIDQFGIVPSLKSAFSGAIRTALAWCRGTVVCIKIDGNPQDLDFDGVPVEYIVRGDDSDWRIGAASVLAKVSRDAVMTAHADEFPAYGWDRNRGYGSPEHQEAIRVHGLTPQHRATFCRRFLPEDNVLDLFPSGL